MWEEQLAQSKEAKQCFEEEQVRLQTQFSSEKNRIEEQHKVEVHQLQKQLSALEEVITKARLQLSQSEASSEEFRGRCGQLVEDMAASSGRCAELEARLEEACTQLEESISFLESQEALNKQLHSEKESVEEELRCARSREEQLLLQMSQQKEELGNLQAASHSIQQDRQLVADNCSRLSCAFIQQQAQLRAREQTVLALRAELESLQGTMKTRTESLSKKSAELDSLKMDRDRLIQDLKEQAMAVDNLQLELDGLSEELDRGRCAEEALQVALKQEQALTLQIHTSLDEEREEVHCLSQEKAGYTQLADQLSTQIVEMEEEISMLRDHLGGLSSQLNETADLVLNLRRELNSKSSEVDGLRAELAEDANLLQQAKTSSERDRSEIQKLTNQLEEKDVELNRVTRQVLHLQQALQEYQEQLMVAEQDFDQEKHKIKQQLLELETLVLALEEVMDPASPHRFVEHETAIRDPDPNPNDD